MSTTLTSPLTSSIEDASLSKDVIDARHIDAKERGAFLRSKLEHTSQHRTTIFLLSNDLRSTLQRLANLQHVLADIDGSVSGVGATELDPSALEEFRQLEKMDLPSTGVTGRHADQIRTLYRNHGNRMKVRGFIAEQGAYWIDDTDRVEYFLGNPEIEEQVGVIRDAMQRVVREIEQRQRVRFIPTSDGGHRSQLSLDALTQDTARKITSMSLHQEIAARFREAWNMHPMSATWGLGTSSTGTFEWTNEETINKNRAVEQFLGDRNIPRHASAFLGDSSNDLPVFRANGLLKVGVVNSHTPDALLEQSDIACIGEGNGAPALALLRRAKMSQSQL